MNPRVLEEIGLTKGESKVYLALLELGSTKTGALAKKAEVSSSKVYKIIDRLMKKGLAGFVKKGKVNYYTAMDPKRVLEYMEEKERNIHKKKEFIKQIIPELEITQKMAGQKTDAVIYEGFKAVTNLYKSIITDLKRGEEYYVLGATYGEIPGLRAFFHNFHIQRAKKGVKVKMLANYNTKDNLEKTTYKKGDIKFLPQYLIGNLSISFYKNKTNIFIVTEKIIGFQITGEEVVKSFRKYFDVFWEIGEKGKK
ncbi:MAG: helix-turn-helix domain-containing protein [archaeon]